MKDKDHIIPKTKNKLSLTKTNNWRQIQECPKGTGITVKF